MIQEIKAGSIKPKYQALLSDPEIATRTTKELSQRHGLDVKTVRLLRKSQGVLNDRERLNGQLLLAMQDPEILIKPDKEIGRKYGLTVLQIREGRLKTGLKKTASKIRRGDPQETVEQAIIHHPQVGKIPDDQLAEEIGCSKWAVCAIRTRHNIPTIMTIKEQVMLFEEFFGKVPDRDISQQVGCHVNYIGRIRTELGRTPGKGGALRPCRRGSATADQMANRPEPGPGTHPNQPWSLPHSETWYMQQMVGWSRDLRVRVCRAIWWEYSDKYKLTQIKDAADIYCDPYHEPELVDLDEFSAAVSSLGIDPQRIWMAAS